MGINASTDENGKVDELVMMIDKLISDGSGSLVITTNENSDEIKVSTTNSRECAAGKSACCQPNEPDDEFDLQGGN